MPRNGSGTYNPPVNSWSPATNGVPATASDWQAILNDIRDALTQSVSRDGQTIISGDLQMGGNKLINLEPGSLPGDSAAWQQIFSQGHQVNLASAATVDIGAQNSTLINITGTTTITSFGANYNGPRYIRFDGVLTLTNSATLVLPGAANITTAAGDSAIAVPIGLPATGWRVAAYQRADGRAISDPASFPASSLTGTVAISNGGTGQTTAADAFNAVKQPATDSATGVVELATNAEAQALTDASRVITPLTLAQALKGANQSLSDNGFQSFPGGFKVQWGQATSSGTTAPNLTVTLPSAFSTKTVMWGGFILGSGAGDFSAQSESATSSQIRFVVKNGSSIVNGVSVVWFAFGY